MKQRIEDTLMRVLTWLAALITMTALFAIIAHIIINGLPHIKPSLFSFTYTTENVSLMPALITTIMMVALTLVIAVPLGIGAAIYLTEYAKRGSKLVSLIRMTTETLSGIPSIIYGLFGMLLFAQFLGWGYSLLSGCLTLAIMVLPLIIRTTEEALVAVPDSFREGAFGLGTGRLRTIFRIVLPSAAPAIVSGIILAIGRIVGESAALLYTAGSVAQIPSSLLQSGRTLAIHLYALSGEGIYMDEACATALVLLIFVGVINWISAAIAKKIAKR